MTLKNDEKSVEELTCCFKIDVRNLTNFESSAGNFYVMGCFWPKYIMFELKKYRRAMFDGTQDWYKVWMKTDFNFQKWHEEFGKFSPEHLKVSELGTFMASFCPKLKIFERKIYRGVVCHNNEEWCKNWRGIDLSVQIWHEEFDRFWPEHSKISKIYTLMGCFWPKYTMLEPKKYGEVMFDSIEHWCKIWRKTDLCFPKWPWK